VFPRKANSVNGSDWIVNHPGLSAALKQCAGLRKQFLRYFTDGNLIGNCILTEPCPNTHISAYVLPDRQLMIVLNQAGRRNVAFKCDLEPWLKSASGKYAVKAYDADGKLLESLDIDSPVWNGSTHSMDHLDMALFEFVAE